MEDKKVQNLATEPFSNIDERVRLSGELEKPQAGSRALSKFNVRKVATGLPRNLSSIVGSTLNRGTGKSIFSTPKGQKTAFSGPQNLNAEP
ncbi:hypothetical protein N7495_004460 [Penicillium taxi]|uniref:uncharacterized protein n=1 Tax=Penicillium taxi TaxID=168475 RepID=UPI002545257B|nr:uncharacterized protein N7495_004460 [Penicillium taxi]KAJ5899716.1 hypothetical protein N7495_004460 [Penicillium taxi]